MVLPDPEFAGAPDEPLASELRAALAGLVFTGLSPPFAAQERESCLTVEADCIASGAAADRRRKELSNDGASVPREPRRRVYPSTTAGHEERS